MLKATVLFAIFQPPVILPQPESTDGGLGFGLWTVFCVVGGVGWGGVGCGHGVVPGLSGFSTGGPFMMVGVGVGLASWGWVCVGE